MVWIIEAYQELISGRRIDSSNTDGIKLKKEMYIQNNIMRDREIHIAIYQFTIHVVSEIV